MNSCLQRLGELLSTRIRWMMIITRSYESTVLFSDVDVNAVTIISEILFSI